METTRNIALIVMALAVTALCVILAVMALALYPEVSRSADNLEQATEAAVAVTENLETVSADLATVSDNLAAVSEGVAAVYDTLTAAVETFGGLLGGLNRLPGLFGGGN